MRKGEGSDCVCFTSPRINNKHIIIFPPHTPKLKAPGALSAADEAFEREHDTLLAEGLLAQVNEMKDLAIDIGTEVRSHNKFLDGMEEGGCGAL